MVYKYVQGIYHKDPTYSSVAYLYECSETRGYYISNTQPQTKIDATQSYLMSYTEPITERIDYMKDIGEKAEVLTRHWIMREIKCLNSTYLLPNLA